MSLTDLILLQFTKNCYDKLLKLSSNYHQYYQLCHVCIINIMHYIVYSQRNKRCTLCVCLNMCLFCFSYVNEGRELCVVFQFKNRPNHLSLYCLCFRFSPDRLQLNSEQKNSPEKSSFPPPLMFPQDIYQVCAAVCVGFTAYITRTTFIKFYFST